MQVLGCWSGDSCSNTLHCQGLCEKRGLIPAICGNFDSLLGFAHDLKERVAKVYTTQEKVSGQVDSVQHCIDKNTKVSLMVDAVKRLNEVCRDSYGTTSRKREDVKAKVEQLKANALE